MKYLGLGHSVGAQNEEKSSSPLISRRRPSAKRPGFARGNGTGALPLPRLASPSPSEHGPAWGPGREARSPTRAAGAPSPPPASPALPAAARPLLPAAQPRGSGVGGQGPAAAGSGFPRPSASPRRRPGCRRGFPGGCSRPACVPAPGRSGKVEQLSDAPARPPAAQPLQPPAVATARLFLYQTCRLRAAWEALGPSSDARFLGFSSTPPSICNRRHDVFKTLLNVQ